MAFNSRLLLGCLDNGYPLPFSLLLLAVLGQMVELGSPRLQHNNLAMYRRYSSNETDTGLTGNHCYQETKHYTEDQFTATVLIRQDIDNNI